LPTPIQSLPNASRLFIDHKRHLHLPGFTQEGKGRVSVTDPSAAISASAWSVVIGNLYPTRIIRSINAHIHLKETSTAACQRGRA
jgi:hypothetical protein